MSGLLGATPVADFTHIRIAIGFCNLTVIIDACRREVVGYGLSKRHAHAPRWIWIGGIVGVVYITGALMLAPKLGAAGFIMAVIAGQMLASIIIDQWSLVGLPQQPVSWSRLAGLGLIFLGLIVMQLQTFWLKPPAGS
jgi:uncharacterized membrane protein YdcZ (DUF606 family)